MDILRDILIPLIKPDPVVQDEPTFQDGKLDILAAIKNAINLGGNTAMLGTVGPKNFGKAGVMAGMKHAGSAASPEAFSRLAGGTRFFRVNRAGTVTPMLDVAAVDNLANAGEAIVRVSPNGEAAVTGGQVTGKAMQDAIAGLRPGKARNVASRGAEDIGSEGVDDAIEFLRSLGVEF
jgi:hypothetical protein